MSLEDFKLRLFKMSKHYGKWARRQNLQAYRIYDRDLKDFPYIIERYREYLHVASAFKVEREGDEEKNASGPNCLIGGLGNSSG
jgi:23S rRNA (cytosine1962-C5)-methyltransferase